MKAKYTTFEIARKIVHELNLKSNSEWRTFSKSEQKPNQIPSSPDKVYKNKGWVNWPDWLGTNTKPNKNPYLSLPKEQIRKIYSEKLNNIIRAKEGQIINGSYISKISKLSVRCKNGHIWETQVQTIMGGSWCRKCFNENSAGKHLVLKDGLEQSIKIAKERKGKCLSTEYINALTKLLWECNNGHQWEATLSDIKKGTWCPICGQGVRERICREIFKQITGIGFPKKRPKWLVNSRNNQMELDGYCTELKIAFEYHGEYHYIRNNHFQRRNETLVQRKIDDNTKIKLCEEHNVKVIIVPYHIKTVDLKDYIFEQLKALNLGINLNVDTQIEYVVSNELEELREIAKKRGGVCLSNIYLGVTEKHKFQCSKGHIWEALASNIKSARKMWCPTCKPERIGNSNRKYTLQDMIDLARKKKGKFISKEFKSVNDKYLWECKKKHQWSAAPIDIMKGGWCKKCSILSRTDTIDEMQKIAKSRGGRCLSTEYINSQTKLLWECQYGHQWEAKPNNIKINKSWCPYCSRSNRNLKSKQ